MNETLTDVLEARAASPAIKKIHTCCDEAIDIKSVGQCGKKCPSNSSSHRGSCYLDFGHSQKHKCSVDGEEWEAPE